jgi:hypothetical protein
VPSPCVHLFLGGHILHTASLNRTGARNFALTTFQKAWKSKNLKSPGKGMAILLGGVWFWYQEGIDAIKEIMLAGQG